MNVYIPDKEILWLFLLKVAHTTALRCPKYICDQINCLGNAN